MLWPSGPFPVPVSRVNIRPWFSGQTKHINKDDSVSRKRWPLGSEETQSPQPSLAFSQSEGALPLPSYISLYISRSWGADKEPRGSPSAAPYAEGRTTGSCLSGALTMSCSKMTTQHATSQTLVQSLKQQSPRCPDAGVLRQGGKQWTL